MASKEITKKYLKNSAKLMLAAILICGTVVLLQNLSRTSAEIREAIEQQETADKSIKLAGELIIDAQTKRAAVGALPVDFVRSPDNFGNDKKGRYLLAVNSGFGVQFDAKSNDAEQSLAIIDLNAEPSPQVIQNVYFPSPQSVNCGVRFHPVAAADGSYRLYVSGGFENKIWIFKFTPNEAQPLTPVSDGKDENGKNSKITAPFIDVSALAENAPSPNYNDNVAAVYPTGIALSPDGETIFTANNLGDSLGIVSDLRDARALQRISLRRPRSAQFVYPYTAEIIPAADGKNAAKVYVSLWGDGSVAVVDLKKTNKVSHIEVERHPTAMLLNREKTKLYVVNSGADSVSVIDTHTDELIENINIKIAETKPPGASPESLALSADEKTLYVANAHANAVAVVELAENQPANKKSRSAKKEKRKKIEKEQKENEEDENLPKNNKQSFSKLRGLIPTGNYPSAVAVAGDRLFIGNGKGTGVENSSLIVNESGLFPNAPNEQFPPAKNRQGGQYSVSVVAGNLSQLKIPKERELFNYTQTVMKNNGLIGERQTKLFKGISPIKHIIYIIKENRTYDQVYGDLQKAGDGSPADGDAKLAIFGAGNAAHSPTGKPQNITPNQRSLALRFGLFDRFFVNSEASPDGHNWSTAAFSSDYVDKAFRWQYSGRGRTYDYEGFNRLPSYSPPANQPPVSLPPVFDLPADENDIAAYLKRYVPYLHGARDIAEPETLYLWDAAKRANLTFRNYGEFVATVSEADVTELNTSRAKKYPDISPTKNAFATKRTLEGNFSATLRNFDMMTPDIVTTDSYRAAVESNGKIEGAISPENPDPKFRGNSRFGEWKKEFQGFVADLNAGRGDRLPNLSIVRFSSDHTAGLHAGIPTPQFYVAENDYAVGRLVEEVSKSPYWKNTAIFVVEDDAQDGPDHVDAHRAPVLVVSAYNKKGALIRDFHNTVSLIRTMEILLGIEPMNLLDATAVPMNIFSEPADLTPFEAVLPDVAADNLFPPKNPSAALRSLMNLTDRQDLKHADMANPQELNEIIWFSVRGKSDELPENARLPAFDLMTAGLMDEDENEAEDKTAEQSEKTERGKSTAKSLKDE